MWSIVDIMQAVPPSTTQSLLPFYFYISYHFIFLLIMFPLVFVRRNKFPLKQRGNFLLFFNFTSGTLVVIVICIRYTIVTSDGVGLVPCPVSPGWSVYFLIPIYVLPLLLSSWRLFFIYRLHSVARKKLISAQQSNEQDDEKVQALIKQCKIVKFLFSPFCMGIIVVIISMIHIIAYGINLAVDPKFRVPTTCVNPQYFGYILIAQYSYFIPIIIAGILNFRARDRFFIFFETYIAAFLVGIGVLLNGILLAIPSYIQHVENTYFKGANFPLIATIIGDILRIVVPTILSFNWGKLKQGDWKGWWDGRQLAQQTESDRSEIHKIMQDPVAAEILREYCAKEWSTENFYFLMKMREFSKLTDETKKRILAKTLIDQYLKPEGVMALNIDNILIDEVMKKYEQKLNDKESGSSWEEVFLKVEKAVEGVMGDTLNRFRQTNEYKKIQKLEQADKLLAESGIKEFQK